MLVGIFEAHADDVARGEVAGIAEVDLAVDFGGVGLRAAGGALLIDYVDRDVDSAADLGGKFVG